MEERSLVPNKDTSRNGSWVWKNITSPLQNPSDRFVSNLRWVLGDGSSIRFWSDYWTEVPSLKEAFPRIFRLAANSSGFVCEFGIKTDNMWRWDITLRRELFEWEKLVWVEFLGILNRASTCSGDKDQIKWCGSSSGIYKSRDYCWLESAGVVPVDKFWKMIWVNLAPPKVEMFVWRAVLNKIPTYQSLLKRGVHRVGNGLCVFCSNEVETSSHLFCRCGFTWKAWQKWCNCWGISLVMPDNIRGLIEVWYDQRLDWRSRPVWIMALFGFIWSIWLYRNERIFNNKPLNANLLFDSALMRIAFWCKCKWPESFTSTLEFMAHPNLLSIGKIPMVRPRAGSWITPPIGSLKFNVDASVDGSFGVSGLGGILRDDQGKHLLKFSKCGGLSDPTGAELLAILEAGKKFAVSKWGGNLSLIIETDSQLAFRWITEDIQCPDIFEEAVSNCKKMYANFKYVVEFVYREQNGEAHRLAKEGKRRALEMMWVVDA